MAIVFPQGFEVASSEPIDNRFTLTKAQMKTLIKGDMPEKYFCICKDDGKLYIWDADFEKTEDLGRFKSYEEIFDMPAALDNAIASALESLTVKFATILPGALKAALEGQGKDSGLVVDEAGNIGLYYDEDLFKLEGNRLGLNIDLIQAI